MRVSATTAILLVSLQLACGGDDVGEPSTIPDLAGLYSATFDYGIEGDLPDLGPVSVSFTCDGSITIDSQSDGSLSGGFTIPQHAQHCPLAEDGAVSGTFSGTTDSRGGISSADLWVQFFWGDGGDPDCTVTSGTTTMTGSRIGNGFTLSASATYLCAPPGSEAYHVDVELAVTAIVE